MPTPDRPTIYIVRNMKTMAEIIDVRPGDCSQKGLPSTVATFRLTSHIGIVIENVPVTTFASNPTSIELLFNALEPFSDIPVQKDYYIKDPLNP
jgi:hypothetical protein